MLSVMGRLIHGNTVGGHVTPEYRAWIEMRGRCLNPRNKRYARYGGRGIKVCPAWLASFRHFLADMGKKPRPGMSLERKNNNAGYYPANCKWATVREQAKNRVTTKLTWEQVRQIRMMKPFTERKVLADMFKVHPTTISCVVLNKIWREGSS